MSRMSSTHGASAATIAPSPAALIHPDVAWLVLNQLQPISANQPDRLWLHTMGRLACVCSAFNDATKALWSYYDGIADEAEWVRHGLRRDVWWCWAVESNRRRHAAEMRETAIKQTSTTEAALLAHLAVPTPKRKGKARLLSLRGSHCREAEEPREAVAVFQPK